jgi:hypothetical protein
VVLPCFLERIKVLNRHSCHVENVSLTGPFDPRFIQFQLPSWPKSIRVDCSFFLLFGFASVVQIRFAREVKTGRNLFLDYRTNL